MEHPNVVIMAGPNGAGKSTVSKELLSGSLEIRHYVNADTIARGLSDFHSDEMAFKAGKVMLQHLHELAAEKINFAFETNARASAINCTSPSESESGRSPCSHCANGGCNSSSNVVARSSTFGSRGAYMPRLCAKLPRIKVCS